jgi:hypothetical protein
MNVDKCIIAQENCLWRKYVNRCKVTYFCTGHTQKNVAVSKVDKKMYFSPYMSITHTVSSCNCPGLSCATSTVSSFQDGVAAGEGFLCAPFWGVHIWTPILILIFNHWEEPFQE